MPIASKISLKDCNQPSLSLAVSQFLSLTHMRTHDQLRPTLGSTLRNTAIIVSGVV